MAAKNEYKFWKGSNYNRSFLILSNDMVVNNDEIINEIKPEIAWKRSDTGTTVIPGVRYKLFGAMAEKVHKLVTNGCDRFKIEKCRLHRNNFIAKSGFEVPNYNLVVEKLKLVNDA